MDVDFEERDVEIAKSSRLAQVSRGGDLLGDGGIHCMHRDGGTWWKSGLRDGNRESKTKADFPEGNDRKKSKNNGKSKSNHRSLGFTRDNCSFVSGKGRLFCCQEELGWEKNLSC